jgi:serine protease
MLPFHGRIRARELRDRSFKEFRMQWRRNPLALVCAIVVLGGGMLAAQGEPQSDHAAAAASGMEVLHGAVIMRTKGAAKSTTVAPAPLTYHGGVNGTGVIAGASKVYLVYWGSQWNNNDPSGEAAIQQSFFRDVTNSAWNNSVTQYCQGVASGTTSCNGAGTPAINGPTFVDVWYDNASTAPMHPSQQQLANEAARAAQHFGNTNQAFNINVQYVINTATRHNSSGFGSSYCAYHSTASSSYGYLAYTNMPYITDAGASCGANFNGLGPKAGITIVGGHEFAETETDIWPNVGWLDKNGAENGDKCAWISSGPGATANVLLNGNSYPLQSLWSNANGGCVQSY